QEGDLWRWDGFTVRAEAKKPAAVKLEQKNRLAGLESQIEALEPRARAEADAAKAAAARLQALEAQLQELRRAPTAAERAVADARKGLEMLDREAARREAHAASLDDVIRRFEAELAETEAALAAVQAEA